MSDAPETLTGVDQYFCDLSADEQVIYFCALIKKLKELPETSEVEDRAEMLCMEIDTLQPRTPALEKEHDQLMSELVNSQIYGRMSIENLERLADISTVDESISMGVLTFLLKRRLAVAASMGVDEYRPDQDSGIITPPGMDFRA